MHAPAKKFARLVVHRTERYRPFTVAWNFLFRTGERIAFAQLQRLPGVSTVYLRKKCVAAPPHFAGQDLDFTVVVREAPPDLYRYRLATIHTHYHRLRRAIPFLGELELVCEDRFGAHVRLGGGTLSALKGFEDRAGTLLSSPIRPRSVLRDALLRTVAHLTPKYLAWKRSPTLTRRLELDHVVKQVHLRLDRLEGVCTSPAGYAAVWNRLGTVCRHWFPLGPARAETGVRQYPMFGRPDRTLTFVVFDGSVERAADGIPIPSLAPTVGEALYPTSYPIVLSLDLLPAFLELFPFEAAPLAREMNSVPSPSSLMDRLHSRLADCLTNQGTFLAAGERGATRLAEMLRILQTFRVYLETGSWEVVDEGAPPRTVTDLHLATDTEASRCLALLGLGAKNWATSSN